MAKFGGRTKTSGQGRPKGSRNKTTQAREEAIAKGGVTPLDFMLKVLRDPASQAKDKQWAAQNAAPYVHPRLSQIDANHTGTLDVRQWLQKLGEPD